MSENVKSITAAAVIISCLAFLAFLVHEKVDGSIVLALAVVPTLIAYFTRQPEKKDPPTGVVVVAAGIATLFASMVACEPFEPPPQAPATAAKEAYREQQRECVREHDTREAILACRREVRVEWSKDGGAR